MTEASSQDLCNDLVSGEAAYRVFHVTAKWSYKATSEDVAAEPDWRRENLPPGRLWNSTTFYRMPKTEMTCSQLAKHLLTDGTFRPKELKPSTPIVCAKVSHWETWCPDWFSHWTWDVGLSDEDVRESFHRYVIRMEIWGQQYGRMIGGIWYPAVCLMGAEDTWRWRGRKNDGGPNDEPTRPPCRCDSCKARGVVRIDH